MVVYILQDLRHQIIELAWQVFSAKGANSESFLTSTSVEGSFVSVFRIVDGDGVICLRKINPEKLFSVTQLHQTFLLEIDGKTGCSLGERVYSFEVSTNSQLAVWFLDNDEI